MAVGGILLIPDLTVIPFLQVWRFSLPVIMVLTGLFILLQKGINLKDYYAGPKQFDLDQDINYVDQVTVLGIIQKK